MATPATLTARRECEGGGARAAGREGSERKGRDEGGKKAEAPAVLACGANNGLFDQV